MMLKTFFVTARPSEGSAKQIWYMSKRAFFKASFICGTLVFVQLV